MSLMRNVRSRRQIEERRLLEFTNLVLFLFIFLFSSFFLFLVISPYPHVAAAPFPLHPRRLRASLGFSALFHGPLMTFSFSGLFHALSSLLSFFVFYTGT